jgi:mannose-1-phosphate guanylyltransferase
MGGVMTRWAIILAAGDGRRVSAFTLDDSGKPMPKQFWQPFGEESLLRLAIDRASRWVPLERILVVVSVDHQRWWKSQLSDVPSGNVIVQPTNRGTAAGILLPYLHILERDPDPLILVLPSDHHVRDEETLAGVIRCAASIASVAYDRAVLLGMTPHEVVEGCGWIVVAAPHSDEGPWNVSDFVEKPDPGTAKMLALHGGLINTMIIATRRRALSVLLARTVPGLLKQFLDWREEAGVNVDGLWRLYESLPIQDFSRDVLQPCGDSLLVLPVGDVGWVDLGTPERLRHFVRETAGFHGSASVDFGTRSQAIV